ncbi:hypothetical protein GPECTOR_31g315 [Gonium pectorale]|uniref:Uncharacterized protein n=1 Tax=Gonium pectorale TaxID=33097 RepID=A0A150GDU6_GONPE|nr:hypothetical protein GPECTOR_31g315 [Gonium pectorale]|eukprot:KXZ47953.1 hypothetical protein GPECTOR_31g315 [Gonium pectorale]
MSTASASLCELSHVTCRRSPPASLNAPLAPQTAIDFTASNRNATDGRRLAASPETSSASYPLGSLASQLADRLPSVEAAEAALGAMRNSLQASDYDASRDPSTYAPVADATRQVVAGAKPLTAAATSQLIAKAQRLGADFRKGPLQALQALQAHLGNISANVVDVGAWNVSLSGDASGGARTIMVSELVRQVLDYAQRLPAAAANGTAVGGGGRRSVLQAPSVPAEVAGFSTQQLAEVGELVATLNTSIASLASAIIDLAAVSAAGPDPSAAIGAISSSLRPALAALVGPTAALSSALSAHTTSATAGTLATLRDAAVAAGGPVAAAVTALNDSLPGDLPSLAAAARALEGPASTLGSAAATLNDTLSDSATWGTLQGGESALVKATEDLGLYTSLVDSLPSSASIEWTLRQAAGDVTDTVADLSGDVLRVAKDASGALGSAIRTLQTDVLARGEDFVDSYSDGAERANQIVYAVWMAAWGLVAALLLLLLLLSVWANWPMGLVASLLVLLAVLAASQVLCSVLALGMAAVADGCQHVERLALQQIVQHTSNPKLAVMMSYYLFRVPASQEAGLQASFGLNVSAVRAQVESANDTLVRELNSRFQVRGQLGTELSRLESLAGNMYDDLNQLLDQALYERVKPLYQDAKSVVCCRAGRMAYNQWCATTAMGGAAAAAALTAAATPAAAVYYAPSAPPATPDMTK